VPVSVPREPDEPAAGPEPASQADTSPPPTTPGDQPAEVRMLALDQVVPNPDQPRRDFDPAALEELASSIRTAGLMQPIVVRAVAGGAAGSFQIVVGERRWRAARIAGLDRLPAIVRSLDDRTVAEWALIENLQREDLNPMERAEAFRRLTDEYDLTHQDVADRVGLNRSTVTNLMRLLELDDGTKELVRRGQLGMAQARALLAITNLEARLQLARLAMREGWSVRTLEQRAAALAKPRGKGRAANAGSSTPHRADLERRLGEHLGTKVQVQSGKRKGSGKLIIDFFSFDQFEGLMERMGFDAGREP